MQLAAVPVRRVLQALVGTGAAAIHRDGEGQHFHLGHGKLHPCAGSPCGVQGSILTPGMDPNRSIQFFDTQFRRQLAADERALNPFEQAALPYLRGKVLDFGCGLGNLALHAARQGCTVVALDASRTAIEHLRARAVADGLALHAEQADLRHYRLREDFDAVVCIGLLMFFDCPTAFAQLAQLKAHVRPGGVAVVNVLTEGTNYMDMFAPEGHCLFPSGRLGSEFDGWDLASHAAQAFAAPGDTRKVFATAIARRPKATGAHRASQLDER